MGWYNSFTSWLGEKGYNVYSGLTGDEDMSGVFGSTTGNADAEDNAFTTIMNRAAGGGELARNDTERFATIAVRSMAEKGPGTILAIPGDLADFANMGTQKFLGVGYNGSVGDWTRDGWYNGFEIGGARYGGIKPMEEALGIPTLEIQNENEAFVSGLYAEVPGNAVMITNPLGGVKALTATTTLGKIAQSTKMASVVLGKTAMTGLDTASMAVMGEIAAEDFEAEHAVDIPDIDAHAEIERAAPPPSTTTTEFNTAAQDNMWGDVLNLLSDAFEWVQGVAVQIAETLGLRDMFNDKASQVSEGSVAEPLNQPLVLGSTPQQPHTQQAAVLTPHLGA